MSEKFFCPSCTRHKDISLKSDQRSGPHFRCTPCVERINKKMATRVFTQADGTQITITAEQRATARIKTANRLILAHKRPPAMPRAA